MHLIKSLENKKNLLKPGRQGREKEEDWKPLKCDAERICCRIIIINRFTNQEVFDGVGTENGM